MHKPSALPALPGSPTVTCTWVLTCILQKHGCLHPLVHRRGLRSQAPGWRGGRPVVPACANLCRCVCHFCMCCLVCFLLSPGWALKTHRIPWTGGSLTREVSCLCPRSPSSFSLMLLFTSPAEQSQGICVEWEARSWNSMILGVPSSSGCSVLLSSAGHPAGRSYPGYEMTPVWCW